ncbi:MAG: 50S ribosomal protein L9 [Elusimicrobia bacterium RIFOXYB2_FULL_48_7]|nr:MAG: 50S ribosomal protein L9 [Elusimicrobia bacterium RIFOXYB2_FULL_48_7]
MKVILKENVEKVGKIGDIKEVSAGFARNFLLPKKLALQANKQNMAVIVHEKQVLEKQKVQDRAALKEYAEKLSKASININVKTGEEGKLFGSVTKDDIAEQIKTGLGYDINKKDIVFEDQIKETGLYSVEIRLKSKKFPEDVTETAKMKVWVVEEKEQK